MQLNNSNIAAKAIKYFLLVIIGLLIIVLYSFIEPAEEPTRGDNYYTMFLMRNYTMVPKIFFVVTGFIAGYVYKLDPWFVGLSLILIFPLTSITEGIIYKGSHNLIPIEFAFHFWLALPSIIAAFVGRFVFSTMEKRERK